MYISIACAETRETVSKCIFILLFMIITCQKADLGGLFSTSTGCYAAFKPTSVSKLLLLRGTGDSSKDDCVA